MSNITKLQLSEELYSIVYDDTAILNRLDNIENSIQSTKEEIETNVANTYIPKTGGVVNGSIFTTGILYQQGLKSPSTNTAPERWVHIATLKTRYQYNSSILRSLVFTDNDGYAYSLSAIIHCRLKQQKPMGEEPAFSIRIIGSDGWLDDDFAGRIITNTAELTEFNIYAHIYGTHRTMVHCPIAITGEVEIKNLDRFVTVPDTEYGCNGTTVGSSNSAASF